MLINIEQGAGLASLIKDLEDLSSDVLNLRGPGRLFTADEVHSCLRCGQQAQVAYVADTQIRPRWLDLCFGCSHWLRSGLTS